MRRGQFFADTPGVGSASERAGAITFDFLPQAHAIIIVTSVEAPMSEAKMALLASIRLYGRQLFIAVNKMYALCNEPEASRATVLARSRNAPARRWMASAFRSIPSRRVKGSPLRVLAIRRRSMPAASLRWNER